MTSSAPGRLLTEAAGDGQTGALVVGGPGDGTLYLLDGQVTYAESAAAPGVGELLTASGRLSGHTWQAALDAGTSRGLVGKLLVEQGHLTQGELELCVLGATYDAAYFALSRLSAPVSFLEGATHWLGPVVRIEPAALTQEASRRSRLLDDIFPDRRVDSLPVSPVPRPPRERVTLTAPQWELLVSADGQRTPADLALLLGRAGYATIQELRRMAALGLLELPPPPGRDPDVVRLPRTYGTAVDVRRPEPAPGAGPVVLGSAPVTGPPAYPLEPAPPGAGGTMYRPPRLARRKPGAKLPKELATGPVHTGTDEVLLKRIRTALRALR